MRRCGILAGVWLAWWQAWAAGGPGPAEEGTLATSPLAEAVARAGWAQEGARGRPATNYVAIINNGYDALLLRVHLIRQARRSVAIQTFIWTNDECGRLLICELIEAARRGVRVRVLADHLVSERDPGTMAFLATAHPNLEVRHYRPAASRIKPSALHTALSGLRSFKGVNQRMHNKVVIVDDVALVTGGRNVENTYYNHSTEMNFKDRDALAIGPVVREAVASFEAFWSHELSVASRDLIDVREALAGGTFRRFEQRADYAFGPFFKTLDAEEASAGELACRFVSRLRPVTRVRFVADAPGKNRSFFFWGRGETTRELSAVLASATNTVFIQSPYLVVSPRAAELLRDLRKRWPRLRVAVSSNSFGSTDNILAYSANYRLRANYVEGLGLEIHEYMPQPGDLARVLPQYPALLELARQGLAAGRQERLPFLCIHAKSLVVDGRIAFIGSFNLDPRSENLNTEVGLLIEDAAVARELQADIENDMVARNSWVIARRAIPLHLDKVNALLDGVLGRVPLDIWPLQNTTSFALQPGRAEVPPGHADFYWNYREAGDFPGAVGTLSNKEILTRLYKVVGTVITPVM